MKSVAAAGGGFSGPHLCEKPLMHQGWFEKNMAYFDNWLKKE